MKKQKNLDLKVEAIGEPSVEALPESEQTIFFKTLLNRIKELKDADDKKSEANNQGNNT